jgi:uncharacterized OsmC-like protein
MAEKRRAGGPGNRPAAKVVNGVDADQLRETVRAIGEDPEVGRFSFRAHSKWAGGLGTETTIRDFRAGRAEDARRRREFRLNADEPSALLGSDSAPNATEIALHALASCVTATFMFQAALRGVEVDEFRVDVEGDIDLRGALAVSDRVPVGFENVRLKFEVKSGAPRETIEELCQLARKYSPVYNTFANRTPLAARVEYVGRPEGASRRAA